MLALIAAPNRCTDQASAPPDQAKLVESLRQAAALRAGASAEQVRVIETHISYVLLTGTFAYKIKKAIDLQFVNFSTLAARRRDCDEEIRLNRPLAPILPGHAGISGLTPLEN